MHVLGQLEHIVSSGQSIEMKSRRTHLLGIFESMSVDLTHQNTFNIIQQWENKGLVWIQHSFRESEIEAQIAKLELDIKTIKISIKAIDEYLEILGEDNDIISKGVTRIENAILTLKQKFDQCKRLESLIEAYSEQCIAIDLFQGNVNEIIKYNHDLQEHCKHLKKEIITQEKIHANALCAWNCHQQLENSKIELDNITVMQNLLSGLTLWQMKYYTIDQLILKLDSPSEKNH